MLRNFTAPKHLSTLMEFLGGSGNLRRAGQLNCGTIVTADEIRVMRYDHTAVLALPFTISESQFFVLVSEIDADLHALTFTWRVHLQEGRESDDLIERINRSLRKYMHARLCFA